MTLMNGLTLESRALLWSDTVAVDYSKRERVGYVSKMMSLSTFPAAVNMTTIGVWPEQVAEMIGTCWPAQLGDLLECCEVAARRISAGGSDNLVRLLVAGWCYETNSARMFVVSSDELPNVRPFVASESRFWVSSGNTTEPVQAALVRGGASPENMIEIAEAQRAEPIVTPVGTMPPGIAIGGNLVEAQITRFGVTSRVARYWDAPVEREAA